MNSTFHGTLFDGETLAGLPVVLGVAAGRLQSSEAAPVVDASLADVAVSDRLADVPRFLYLPNNRTIETGDNGAIDALLEAQRRGRLVRIVHALEAHSRAAAAATVILVAATVATIAWGLPVLARRAALAVPESIEKQAGQAGLVSLSAALAPSTLSADRRSRVQAQLDRLMRAGGYPGSPKLEFRSMGGTFPNAFAFPGGILVMSDELVALATNDEELAAVLAHEIAHWQRRHGLQTLFRSSAALLVVSTVTGDLSALTTFAGTIPFLLLQTGYSREFESEADADAVRHLVRAGIDPGNFASILHKLDKAQPTTGPDYTYLSTHPGQRDRIRNIHATALQAGWKPLPPNSTSLTLVGSPPDMTGDTAQVVEAPDVRPKNLFQRSPEYPTELRRNGISGSVVVEFVIGEDGNTSHIKVVRSTHREFEAPAMAAVAEWKFEPGRKDGRVANVLSSQLFEFNALE